MRIALNILAIVAVLLSGFTRENLLDVAGQFSDTTAIEHLASLDTKPVHQADDDADKSESTSDCHTTSVYLMSSQAAEFFRAAAPLYRHRSDRADGAQPLPLTHPPRSRV